MHSSGQTPIQELHRLAFDRAPDPLVVLDGGGRVVIANRAARALPGIPLERLFAPDASWSQAVAAFLRDVGQSGRASVEITIGTLGGGPRQILLCGDAEGLHHVVSIRDVTELRRLESEARHLRRLESVGQLTASVVHDFNNLLTPILCLSGLLQRGLEHDPRNAEFARDVRAAAERAAGLVRQVLALARRAPAQPGRVNVGSAIAELQPLLDRVAGPTVEVELAADDDAADAVIDREQLEHVLLNLAANGRDAMPRGGRLMIRTASIDLNAAEASVIEGSKQGAYVAVIVTDTGVGMTSEVRERIYEGFFTTKAAGEGTGLGLAAARRFMSESKGCMAVHSEPGRGTTVALYFPRAEAPELPASSSKIHVEPAGGTEAILVVDDDRVVRGAMRAVLEDRGYTVYEAGTAEEAAAVARREETPMDLLVVDVVLGTASGRDIARRVRALRSGVKVLYTSGHTSRVLEKHGIADGDPALLRKAFTPTALARKVRAILDGTPRESAA